MFKLSPLLIFLLPISNTFAAQPETQTDTDKQLTEGDEQYDQQQEDNIQTFLQQCYQMVPARITPTVKTDKNNTPVGIDAETLSGSGGEITYSGNVSLTQGDKTLTADSLSYNRKTDQASAKGNAVFKNGQLTLNADQIDTNLSTDESTLTQTKYQFHGQGGRGSADSIHDNGKDVYSFNNSSYTACPPNDSTWSIDSSTLEVDNNENMGTAYNAVLRIRDVPVFYFPYISYPLTDTRKTGFLFPSFEYSSIDGITISQPLYINIAPNQDATVTPTYMNNRGLLMTTEYRYLFGIGEGTVQAEYLSDDKLYEGENSSRHLVHLDHDVSFAQDWGFTADYTRVSDDNYFSDIDSDYGSRSENQLLQTAKLSYTKMSWESELEVRNFQILNDSDKSHIVMPKLSYSAFQPFNWRSLQFDWYSEITHFDHSDDDVYTGTRLHMEPQITLPLYYNSMFINTELKYMISYYQQDLDNATKYDWYDNLEEQTSRYIPSFKVHSGINLERDFQMFDNSYRQTLIPQVQYLYVPYKDQSAIGIYDTTTLQQDYYGLFRDNIYSGYDRIANANQITVGLSTSFLDPQGREKLRFAVGQNYYFSQSRTTLPSDDDDSSDSSSDEISRSSIIGEFDMNFADNYFFHAGLEWDSDDTNIQRANSTFEKRWTGNTFMQLSYRYYRADDDAYWYEEVNQVGSKVNWSINTQWTTFASYYYDLTYSNAFEGIIGVKYQSCCWAIGLTYDEHMKTYTGSDYSRDDIERERSVSLNIELMGLGGVGEATSDQGLFDYGRPFYLK